MQVITEIELLQRIDAFLERHNMAPTTFGRLANGEQQLIDSIRKGRSPSLKVTRRVVEFMDAKDAEASLRAKLAAPLEPLAAEDIQLPFVPAPATGASSPTCSSTSAQSTSSPDSDPSHCSNSDEAKAA